MSRYIDFCLIGELVDSHGNVHYEDLAAIPAADVRPAKYGKWTLNKDGSATCSECHHVQYNAWDLDNWDNFCHFCGADMRTPLKKLTES